MEHCFYHKRGECDGEGKHQCPKCKEWYCGECHEMFLNVAELAGDMVTLPAAICPQCHYATFWRPALEAQIMVKRDKRQAEKERKQAEEARRRTNPDGIFCLECSELCHLSQDGKRWLCKIEAHN